MHGIQLLINWKICIALHSVFLCWAYKRPICMHTRFSRRTGARVHFSLRLLSDMCTFAHLWMNFHSVGKKPLPLMSKPSNHIVITQTIMFTIGFAKLCYWKVTKLPRPTNSKVQSCALSISIQICSQVFFVSGDQLERSRTYQSVPHGDRSLGQRNGWREHLFHVVLSVSNHFCTFAALCDFGE